MKFVPMNEALFGYLCETHSQRNDPLLDELRSETRERFGDEAMMQINPIQGTFLSMLVACTGTRRAIEVGTFTGTSAIAIARGLPAGGELLCLDISEAWTDVAKRYWERAGLADRIRLQLGDAVASLNALPEDEPFDFAFIDAEKTDYRHYYDALLPRMRPNGLMIFDNALRHGRVLDPPDAGTEVIDQLNRDLATDDRVEAVVLPVSDGLLLVRVK